MRAICFAVFFLTNLIWSPAFAAWSYTEWGMTPEQVLKASKGEIYPVEHSRSGADMHKLSGQITDGKFKFYASFFFSDPEDQLVSVSLMLNREFDAAELAKFMEARLGNPKLEYGQRVWRGQTDVISLVQFGKTGVISYRPAAPINRQSQPDPRFNGLSEEHLQRVEKEFGMDRYAILEVMNNNPVPKQISTADHAAFQRLTQQTRVALDNRLPDLPSARLRDIKMVRMQAWNSQSPTYYICGEINSKNRLGAYTGWRQFFSMRRDNGDVAVYFDTDLPGVMRDGICTDRNRRVLESRDPKYTRILTAK